MISMTKSEMIKYLKDYASVQYRSMHNTDFPLQYIFTDLMLEKGRAKDATMEYYERMNRVYTAYQMFKDFSYIEDFLLNRDDFLSNNDLAGIEKECTILEAPNGITNKRIIQLIRNAFNHNDDDEFERFSISVNGRYFQIELKDIRTQKEIENNVQIKPFKMKFNMKYLSDLITLLNEKRQNILFLSFDIPDSFDIYANDLDTELDKIKFIHYYFPKKLTGETVEKFNDLSNSTLNKSKEELLEISEEMHSYAKSLNHDVKEFSLDNDQKNKLKDLIIRYKKLYPKLIEDENAIGSMYYFFGKVIPVPGLKTNTILNQIILSDGYYSNPYLSQNSINRRIWKLVFKPDEIQCDETELTYDKLIKEEKTSIKNGLYRDLLDGEFLAGYPIITYIDSVVTHLCTDEEIIIDGVTYNKSKIRNSLAHGRWYISKNQEVIMFDADPRNINDYNLEFVGKIDISKFEEWAIMYMEKYNNKDKSLNKSRK